MHALSTHLLRHRHSLVAWIDSLGTFSPALLAEIVAQRLKEGGDKETTVESVLDRVQIMRVFDMHGVIEALDELKQSHASRRRVVQDSEGEESDDDDVEVQKDEGDADFGGVRMLVVDTINQPVSALMNKGQLQGLKMVSVWKNDT
jgi:hypothetical protein